MLLANKKVPKKYYVFAFIVGMIGNIAFGSSTLSLIMVALSAIGLFGIVKSINLPDATIYPYMRKMSTVIYFIHMYVWSFYYKIVYGEKTYGMDSFLATALISLVISGIYVGIIRYKKQPDAIK